MYWNASRTAIASYRRGSPDGTAVLSLRDIHLCPPSHRQVFSRRHARDHTGGAPGRRLGSFGVTHLALQMVAWWRGEGFTPAKALEALDFRWARWSKEPVA